MHTNRLAILGNFIAKVKKNELLTEKERTHLTWLLQDLEMEIKNYPNYNLTFSCEDILSAIIYIFSTYEINDSEILRQPELIKLFMRCLMFSIKKELADSKEFHDYYWVLSNIEHRWDYRISIRPVRYGLGFNYELIFDYPPDRVLKVVITHVAHDYSTLPIIPNFKQYTGLGVTKINKDKMLEVVKIPDKKAKDLVKETINALQELYGAFGDFNLRE